MSQERNLKEENIEGTGYIKSIAIDAVIFGFHDNQLKVLLVEYKQTGIIALPGGFIRENEDLNNAARRVVSERTGLDNIYLDQFYVFGDYSRYDPEPFKSVMRANGVEPPENHWLLKRFISVGYYALVDFIEVKPTPAVIFDSCNWYDLTNMPKLIQDHEQIVSKALDALRANLDHRLIGFNLLPQIYHGRPAIALRNYFGQKAVAPRFSAKNAKSWHIGTSCKKMDRRCS